MEVKKNDVYESVITDYTTEGSGVCKINGMIVFVPSAAVGDRVKIKILKLAKNYAFGKIEEIIEKSENRICVDCEIAGKCGGCSFRHITYNSELEFKRKRVFDALTRIGGINGELISEIQGADSPYNYRNKAQLPITKDKYGKIRTGFFAPRSHRIIPLDECKLHSEIFDEAIKIFLEWAELVNAAPYDEQTHTGILRHLYLRYAAKTNQLMVCIVANAKELRKEKFLVKMLAEKISCLKSVILNVNTEKTNVITGKICRTLYGSDYITDELCGLKFRISPLSFYQINRDQAERLYNIAAEFADLNKSETLIDLYCGTGTIGLSMANNVKKLIGVEIIPQAVEDAKNNALFNNITNAEFICSDASTAAEHLEKRDIKADCIIVDPPRKGCDESLINTIVKMSPKRVVYVSCDPATLARDVHIFEKSGYKLQQAVPVDMFPRTPHVETVVLMSRSLTEHEKYGEYFMNRSVSDIMSEYSEQHDEWH